MKGNVLLTTTSISRVKRLYELWSLYLKGSENVDQDVGGWVNLEFPGSG
jgi:hypothetical protein